MALPWSDAFAQASGLSTRNLGFRGYGIRHHAWTWQEYGLQESPDVLIIGFFGGNDMFHGWLGYITTISTLQLKSRSY